MAVSEARKRANKKYASAHYERVNYDVPIGTKERIRQAAAAAGVSPSQYMRAAILAALDSQQQPQQPPND